MNWILEYSWCWPLVLYARGISANEVRCDMIFQINFSWHCLQTLTARTIKIWKFCTIHLIIFDQYVSRWGAKRHLGTLAPSHAWRRQSVLRRLTRGDARYYHLGKLQSKWSGGLKSPTGAQDQAPVKVWRTKSPGAEAVCRHCLQILRAKRSKFENFAHNSPLHSWRVCFTVGRGKRHFGGLALLAHDWSCYWPQWYVYYTVLKPHVESELPILMLKNTKSLL